MDGPREKGGEENKLYPHNFILRSLDKPEKFFLKVPSTRLSLHSSKSLSWYPVLPIPSHLTLALTRIKILTLQPSLKDQKKYTRSLSRRLYASLPLLFRVSRLFIAGLNPSDTEPAKWGLGKLCCSQNPTANIVLCAGRTSRIISVYRRYDLAYQSSGAPEEGWGVWGEQVHSRFSGCDQGQGFEGGKI